MKNIMILSWKHFLLTHALADELNKSATDVQTKFLSTDTPSQKFEKLTEYKNLILLTKSVIGNEIQATFYHNSRKDTFLHTNPFHNAFLGFSARATAIRMDPDKILVHSAAIKPVPSVTDFLKYVTPDDVTNLSGTSREFIQNFAVLPPFLSAALYDLDDWNAESVFFKMQQAIQLRRDNILISKTTQQQNITAPTVTPNDTNEKPDPEHDNTPAATTPTLSTDELATEQLFLPVLLFLWSIIKKEVLPSAIHLPVCPKETTMKWSEAQHQLCLPSNNTASGNPPS